MSEKLIAAVESDPHPRPGQKHRSSVNFSTDRADKKAMYFIFRIDDGNPRWEVISFDVMEDKRGADPVVYKNVFSGNKVAVVSERSLYIANPKNADGDFTVSVYEVR